MAEVIMSTMSHINPIFASWWLDDDVANSRHKKPLKIKSSWRPRMPLWWWLKLLWQPCLTSSTLSLHLLTREPRPWMWERGRQVMLSSCAFTWVRTVYKLQVQHHVWEAFLQVQVRLLRLRRPRAVPKEGYNSLKPFQHAAKPIFFASLWNDTRRWWLIAIYLTPWRATLLL